MRKNTSVQKQAVADASEYAAAYMAYGEGAGNRRKLIEGTVEYKMEFVPGYKEAFNAAHTGQDMAQHAENARKAHKKAERQEAAQRNTRAVLSGDMKNADLKIIALIGAGFFAHKTGLDKKAWRFIKGEVEVAKRKFKKYQTIKVDAEGVYDITDAK